VYQKEARVRVGIRELRDRLKQYVEAARGGEDVIITDRGRAVARLVGLQGERPLDRLVEAGLATLPRRPKGKVDWTPVASSGSVSDLVER
jgi:prevent-host-death family protein